MKTIWKYPVAVVDVQTIGMPLGAEILTIQDQKGTPCIWALVDSDAPLADREIRIAGTGHKINKSIKQYIGSFQLGGGDLVFHVFEIE